MTNTLTPGATLDRDRATARWRTVDIVVASVIGVAFGVVFWGWASLWNVMAPAFAGFPPAQAVIYGMWLVPGVLGALIVRKRGAAVYSALVAALVSAVLGTPWGLSVVLYGLVQGALPELVFALVLYRSWGLATSILAGAAAGVGAALLDLVLYYATWNGGWQLAYVAVLTASAALIAGVGSWLLVRALAQTGVLARFAAGRGQRAL
jgi:energy-coupling factor transport system substrate-specific component